jgi:ABC-type transport system involved in multi-copper enzyme maturation permease subunit
MNASIEMLQSLLNQIGSYAPLALDVSPKLQSWLTPMWMIGVGCILGLILIGLSWALSKGLSRIDAINELAESPSKAATIVSIFALALCVVLAPFTVGAEKMPSAASGGADSWGDLIAAMFGLYFVCWVAGYSFVVLAWKRTGREISMVLREGTLYPILIIVTVLAAVGVLGSLVVQDPGGIVQAAIGVPLTGTTKYEYIADAGNTESESQSIHPIDFHPNEVAALEITTSQSIKISFTPFGQLEDGVDLEEITSEDIYRVNAQRSSLLLTIPFRDAENASLGRESHITKIYIENLGIDKAEVALYIRTGTGYVEAETILITGFGVLVLFLLYLVQRMAMPRLFAVALSTYKSEIAQPLFTLIVVFGVIALIGFVWIPYNTFGEDIKMLKDAGLTLILILSIILALWSASTSVADEIEGRTALTVLSKPLTRRAFVIGKFTGIVWMLALVYIIFGLVFIAAVSYKPIYDATESSLGVPDWRICFVESIRLVPGLLLAFMEAVVIASLSVAISTRLPLMANMTICLVVYALGHLTPLVVQSSLSGFAIVEFFGKLIATVFPNLDHFNIQAAISAGVDVPFAYLGWAFSYCAIYSFIAMLLALVMFEDRDLT